MRDCLEMANKKMDSNEVRSSLLLFKKSGMQGIGLSSKAPIIIFCIEHSGGGFYVEL